MSVPRRTALLVAYHFPPIQGSSGVQRTLRFAQHLPRFGWTPIILSINVRAYEAVANIAGNEVPEGLEVHRAFGLNAATQLSVFGRYPEALALPDRWATWRPFAVRAAQRIIRTRGVEVVWSTFPIATAHEIGLAVARQTGLPWIAELRDPMWQSDWPPEPQANAYWRDLERRIFAAAARAVFVAPSALELYAERFPEFERRRLELIENGYDEDTFRRATPAAAEVPVGGAGGRRLTLLHSGIIYRSERDPTQFFAAIAALKARGAIRRETLRIVLRASGQEGNYGDDLRRLGIDDIVELAPAVAYVSALREMMTVDGLLLLQAANCNAQVPAKIYEYLRANRPVLALTDPAGDTARTLARMGVGLVARLDSATEIEAALLRFIEQLRHGTAVQAAPETVASYSREAQAGQLAALFDRAAAERRTHP